MFAPCPPCGGIITLKTASVLPAVLVIPADSKSTVPYVYPSPPCVTLTVSICPAALTVTEHLALLPFPVSYTHLTLPTTPYL